MKLLVLPRFSGIFLILAVICCSFALESPSIRSTSSSVLTRFVTSADGTQIFAQATGNSRGAHLVLAHGLLLASGTMDDLFFNPLMAKSFFMVRYDLRGHGQSGKPTDVTGYISAKWAEDFNAIQVAFNLKDAFFIGWSYGGSVPADILANIQPHPLKAIISLAGVPYIGPIRDLILTDINKATAPGLIATNDSVLSLNSRTTFVETCFADPQAVQFTLRSEWLGFSASQTPDITIFIQTRVQDPQALLQAGKDGLPLLIIGGTEDDHINITALIQQSSPLFVNLESHLIPNAGHAIFFDATDTTVQLITKFITRVNGGK